MATYKQEAGDTDKSHEEVLTRLPLMVLPEERVQAGLPAGETDEHPSERDSKADTLDAWLTLEHAVLSWRFQDSGFSQQEATCIKCIEQANHRAEGVARGWGG